MSPVAGSNSTSIPMLVSEEIILPFSASGNEEYNVVISGLCIPQYKTKAATTVIVAKSVGNALRKPG